MKYDYNTNDVIQRLDNFYEEIDENKEITFYTEREVFTVPADSSNICMFTSYEDLCEDWLNTDIHEESELYRNPKDKAKKESDKEEYYDYKRRLWFVTF